MILTNIIQKQRQKQKRISRHGCPSASHDAAWLSKAMPVILTLGFILCATGVAYPSEMDLTRAVIHHTATDKDLSVNDIDRIHLERGWDGIGYHFLIRKNGIIQHGRNISKLGAHARGRNRYIGIALGGRNKFTPEQIESLKFLLEEIGVTRIERHHEECPGDGIDVEEMQKYLNS